MEGVMKLIAMAVGILLLFSIVGGVFHKPKPCPRHICLPKEQIVTVEDLMRENPERFQKK